MNHADLNARDIFAGAAVEADRFSRVGEGQYWLSGSDALNTELELTHVRRERYQLYGELTVWSGLAAAATVNGVLLTSTLNLSSIRDRDGIARAIGERTKGTNHDLWRSLLDELAIRVNLAREGW